STTPWSRRRSWLSAPPSPSSISRPTWSWATSTRGSAMAEARGRRGGRLRAYWTGWAGALLVGLMALCALFSPQLAPHDPFSQDVATRLRPPAWARAGSAEHLLGTDHVGRDYLRRIIYSARGVLGGRGVAA